MNQLNKAIVFFLVGFLVWLKYFILFLF